jgi:hypothetical protein
MLIEILSDNEIIDSQKSEEFINDLAQVPEKIPLKQQHVHSIMLSLHNKNRS